MQGISSYYADDANAVTVDGYGILNLGLGMDRPIRVAGGLGIRGSLSINNLLDASYIGSAYLNPDIVNGYPSPTSPACRGT